MIGIYSEGGAVRFTQSSGLDYMGLYAPDGSWYVTEAPVSGYCGLIAPDGSRYVTNATGSGTFGRFAANGSLRITIDPLDTNGALLVSGFLSSFIPDLNLWYDGTDSSTITQSSGSISQWKDKSGNSNHLTQAVGAQQPTVQVAAKNGMNTCRFTAANSQFFHLTSNIVESPFTLISVKRRGGPTGANVALLLGGADTLSCYWTSDGTVAVYGHDQAFFTPTPVASTDYNVVTVQKDVDFGAIFVNSAEQVVSGPEPSVLGTSFSDVGQLGGVSFGNFELGEMLYWSRLLTSGERLLVESYLKNKWGTP